jgi:hypothetical protein
MHPIMNPTSHALNILLGLGAALGGSRLSAALVGNRLPERSLRTPARRQPLPLDIAAPQREGLSPARASAPSFIHEATPTTSLVAADRDELWQLYRRHYDAPRTALEASLCRATLVVRIRHRDTRELCGMVCFSLRPIEHDGRRIFLVWGGAAAFDRACRGKGLLERVFLRLFFRFRLRHPLASLFLIGECCAFQSYRVFASSLDEFWPHPTRPTPAWERSFMDAHAARTAGAAWDAQHRVIRPIGKSIRGESLRTTVAPTDPLWRFFQRQNPGATLGEAMILLAPLHRRNILTMIARGITARRR